MRCLFALLLMLLATPARAQDLGAVLEQNRAQIEKPSRQTIAPVIQAIAAAVGTEVLAAWADRRLGTAPDGRLAIIDGTAARDAATGVRRRWPPSRAMERANIWPPFVAPRPRTTPSLPPAVTGWKGC